jgi:hypothetical protein
MLPVAHGWYSAIYKAFMALRLKPLVPLLKFVALILFLFVNCSSAVLNLGLSGVQIASQQTHLQQNNAFPSASYVDEPLEQLLRIIPEMKTLQPAQDQTQLAMILEHCGKNVDKQFNKFSDLAAKEIVSEIRVNPTTDLWGQPTTHPNEPNLLEDQYMYFIVREGTLLQTRIREYRRDRYGSDGAKPSTSPLLATVPGMAFLSANFASSLLYFSSDLQGQARFRYLGEQHVGARTAYLVAFAQVPGVATVGISMRMPNGDKSNWLMQGIAWIDKSTFEILQMRTDLLVPLDSSSACQQLQTLIQFAPVQFNGVADMMWLPTEAEVHETLGDCKNPVQIARNVHHFSEYRRYGHEEANVATPKETAVPGAYAGQLAVHPYLELPLTQLMKRIPELKGISPAPDQQALPMILQLTGRQVDAFFANLVDVIAHEDITQQRLATRALAGGMPAGTMLQAQEHTQDSYLIMRRTAGPPRIEEFRMDAKGNRMNETGVQNGFFITAGFALSSIHFATGFQWDSRFLYLGNQKIGGHDTYVVAFAQLPSEARVAVTMRGRDGSSLRLLSQGIAWVDKANFHIRRLRTDLLAPQPELGLAEQATTISYSEVRFADAAPLWLPRDVDVNIQFTEHLAGGVSDLGSRVTDHIHHYSNYLLYRVSTKVGVPR